MHYIKFLNNLRFSHYPRIFYQLLSCYKQSEEKALIVLPLNRKGHVISSKWKCRNSQILAIIQLFASCFAELLRRKKGRQNVAAGTSLTFDRRLWRPRIRTVSSLLNFVYKYSALFWVQNTFQNLSLNSWAYGEGSLISNFSLLQNRKDRKLNLCCFFSSRCDTLRQKFTKEESRKGKKHDSIYYIQSTTRKVGKWVCQSWNFLLE